MRMSILVSLLLGAALAVPMALLAQDLRQRKLGRKYRVLSFRHNSR